MTGFALRHAAPGPRVSSRLAHLLTRVATPAGQVETLRAELDEVRTELAQRDSFLAALLETVDVGIISCGPEGIDWARNRASRTILGLDAESRRRLDAEQAAPHLDIRNADGSPVTVDEYPLVRALRGEQVGAVELLVGPVGGPQREIISLNSQIVDARGVVLGAVTALTDVSAERSALRAAGEQRRMLVEAQRIGQIGSFEHDLVTGEWTCSEELLALWGPTTADATQPTGPLSTERIHPDDRESSRAAWAQVCETGGKRTWEHRIVRFDGEERRIRCTVEAESGPDGVATRVRGTNLDITELTAARTAAQAASDFNEAVLTASPDYTFVTDLATGGVVYGSPGRAILGLTFVELAALGPELVAKLVHPDDVDKLRALNVKAASLEDGAVLQVRYRGRHANGEWRWLSRRITPFTRDENGVATQVVGVMRDITDTVLAEERLQHTATHDGLTGLPNRTLLMRRLQDALDRSAVTGGEVTVLFCDLDGFKLINDTAGHAAGDAVLRVTGRRMAAILREGDTVARVGGDEFVVVLAPRTLTSLDTPDQSSRERDRAVALQIANRITSAVRRSIRHGTSVHGVTASVGLTFASLTPGDDGEPVTADSVLKRADDLMYRAKARGKDRVEVLAVS
jgi:diguanylate cyclase (GGDEF)-like protein/PAS domain S-box-containing protein